jgi:hypothetical protein
MQKDPQAVLDVLEFYSENLLDVQEEYDVDTPTSPYDRIPAHPPTSLSYHGTTEGLREFRRDSARKIPTSDLAPFVYGGQQSRQYQRISPLLTEKEKSSSFERRVVDPTLERGSSQDSRISPIENRTSPMERRDRRISPQQQPPLAEDETRYRERFRRQDKPQDNEIRATSPVVRAASPRSPRGTSPRQVSPRATTAPRALSPRHASSRAISPKPMPPALSRINVRPSINIVIPAPPSSVAPTAQAPSAVGTLKKKGGKTYMTAEDKKEAIELLSLLHFLTR